MKACGSPKVYIAVGLGVILLLLTVFLTLRLSEYLVEYEDAPSNDNTITDTTTVDEVTYNTTNPAKDQLYTSQPIGSLL